MAEPAVVRWRRRAVTIPTVLAATAVAVFGMPLLVPVMVVSDVARRQARLPTVRVYLFLLQYLINDSLEIVLAPFLWSLARFGKTLRSPRSRARHLAIQHWSVRTMADRAERLLGLPLELSETDAAKLTPGPVIVLSRHVSLFDASLPGFIAERLGLSVRGVIMAELLADPGFDLIYGRTGSVFISRDDGPAAVAAIEAMAADTDHNTAFVLFPEGRLFRPDVRDRQIARLATADLVRAERLSSLRQVLPPRPGGFLALLDAVPEADVVILDHRGLDGIQNLADLRSIVPAGAPVTVTATRFPRATLPSGREKRIAWLDDIWLGLDRDLGRGAGVAVNKAD